LRAVQRQLRLAKVDVGLGEGLARGLGVARPCRGNEMGLPQHLVGGRQLPLLGGLPVVALQLLGRRMHLRHLVSELGEPLGDGGHPARPGRGTSGKADVGRLGLGPNGTGKSKVLSLTLPFLLDAQINPTRIEPDADSGKRMSWNLLMGQHSRRMGCAWLEFGRHADDGQPHYLTLGAGLLAVEGRPQVDAWYFIIEDAADAPRLNQDLWLTSEQKVVVL
jgi:hypothetical protein